MWPIYWRPPIELSAREQTIIDRIRRAKLFVFLRLHRHEVFDKAFQQELVSLYQVSRRDQPPVPPGLLGLATIAQAYTRVSDDEVIGASIMDRRWQLVLDCVDTEESPFSKGTLIAFRKRLIEETMVQSRVEQTIKVVKEHKLVRNTLPGRWRAYWSLSTVHQRTARRRRYRHLLRW